MGFSEVGRDQAAISRPDETIDRGERIDAVLLSFVASYVDTAVFIGLFGLFTSHVTGNFVLIGATLVHQADGLETNLLALPVFVLAVAVTVLSVRALERRGRGSLPPLLIAEAALLAMSACIKLATLPPTTVMTGNITQATIDAVAIMLPTAGAPERDATVRRFARMWPGIAAFTIGAALGAFGFLAAGLLCLLAPAALCVVLAARLGCFDAAGRVAPLQL